MDYEEKEDRFVVGFDMPGVSKDDVSIKVDVNLLSVKAERKEEVKKREVYGEKIRKFSKNHQDTSKYSSR